jgi:hypothetical protein
MLRTGVATAEARKTALVASIKTAESNVFTDEQLAAKPVAELEALAKLAGVFETADYSGMGLPRALTTNDEKPAPSGYDAAIAARRK